MAAERATRHTSRGTARRRRVAAGLTALAVMGVTVTVAVIWRGTGPRGVLPVPVAGPSDGRLAAIAWPSGSPATRRAAATAAGKPRLDSSDRSSCPPAASACVDLTDHITWLQWDGRVTFGPVRMEPGPPGSPHATPRGTFYVQWKAGADYISNIYGDPMPWAVFFAPGGVAFHGGSLTNASHGCVHLTVVNALYYHDHLPIGAEVVVF
jgi:L,D-transpeptidase catalytic domain